MKNEIQKKIFFSKTTPVQVNANFPLIDEMIDEHR